MNYYKQFSIKQVDKILKVIPRERNTLLFSATMTKKVANKCNTMHERPTNNLQQKYFLYFIEWMLICKNLIQVAKLQRASLQNPVKVEVSSKYQTVDKLQQYYLFIPVKYKVRFYFMAIHVIHVYKIYTDDNKFVQNTVDVCNICAEILLWSCLLFQDVYLVYILNELAGNSFMVFCSTCANTQRVALMLRNLGLTAIPLHGQMSQVLIKRRLLVTIAD